MKLGPFAVCGCVLLFTLIPAAHPQIHEKGGGCVVERSGLRFSCRPGWYVLSDEPDQLTIGNYKPTPSAPKNIRGGRDKAVIDIQTLPRAYRDLSQWIYAGHKLAPDAVETRFSVQNGAEAVSVVVLGSPPGPGLAYLSAFFQIGNVPALLELTYHFEDTKKADYLDAVKSMIANVKRSGVGRR